MQKRAVFRLNNKPADWDGENEPGKYTRNYGGKTGI
jgi:hypothetical protein